MHTISFMRPLIMSQRLTVGKVQTKASASGTALAIRAAIGIGGSQSELFAMRV